MQAGIDGARAAALGFAGGVAGLTALAGEWHALWTRAHDVTPFQHPAWIVAWARHLAAGTPLALTLRRDGALRALLPLHLDDDGTLELAGAPITDYRDVLVDAEEDAGAAARLLAAALRHLAPARLELADLRAGSPLVDAALPPGYAGTLSPGARCPTVTLPASGRLRDIVSERLGEDLVRFRRRLARQGAISVTEATAGDSEGFIDRFAELHAARWRLRGEPGVLADARVHAFHREAARALAGAGLLEALTLALDGRPIAATYALRDRLRSYFYLAGFAPDLARWSPGTLALAAAFEHAMARGARELHFLRGAEAYKYRWGARDRLTASRRITRSAIDGAPRSG